MGLALLTSGDMVKLGEGGYFFVWWGLGKMKRDWRGLFIYVFPRENGGDLIELIN